MSADVLQTVFAGVASVGGVGGAIYATRVSLRMSRANAEAARRENNRADFEVLMTSLRTDMEATKGELRDAREEVSGARADIRVLVGWMRIAVPLMRQHGLTPPPIPEKFDVY